MTIDPRVLGLLHDMLDHARYAQAFVSDVDRSVFENDVEKQFAVVRALEIIGEAAKSVPEEVRGMAPSIAWRQIAATRDKLIHHYFGVDLEIVWDTISHDIPVLITELTALLEELERE